MLEFGKCDALIEFSKCSKSLVLMIITNCLDLFTKTMDPFKGIQSKLPHIVEYHDLWLHSEGTNLARFINGDRKHLTDIMVDDESLGVFSKNMNISQHEALLLLLKFFNIKTKKIK